MRSSESYEIGHSIEALFQKKNSQEGEHPNNYYNHPFPYINTLTYYSPPKLFSLTPSAFILSQFL